MVLVKICGITNFADAFAAVNAGADALGFNFFPESPRYIKPEVARTIIDRLAESLSSDLLTVGVFVNESVELVKKTAAVAGVSGLQLHGDESPEYCKALEGYYLIKAFSAGDKFAPEIVRDYNVQAIMLDAFDRKAFGGTGKLSNWSAALEASKFFPRLFLAGGLSAENVADAIGQVNPYGVDACSRLESVPGRKDHGRVRNFVAAVRAASV
ncbi:MAG: phosphoribosylanthranilate isomerase [Acidobacteriota bacterium]